MTLPRFAARLALLGILAIAAAGCGGGFDEFKNIVGDTTPSLMLTPTPTPILCLGSGNVCSNNIVCCSGLCLGFCQ